MSQSSAYPPEASFRPASGWQHGEQPPQPRPAAGNGDALAATPGTLLVVAFLIISVQGFVATLSIGQPDALQLITTIALWGTSGVVLGALFASATRALPLMLVAGSIAALDAVTIAVLLALGSITGWESAQLLPILLSVSASIIGVLEAKRGRGRVAVFVASGAVALFYLTAAAAHALRVGIDVELALIVLRSLPIALLAIVAALACTLPRLARVAGIALLGLALALLIAPLISWLVGSPPVLASLAVLVARFVLVAMAGILVLRSVR